MNLSALRTSLRMRIGNPSTTDVSDADLTGHINSAYQEILNKFKFKKRRGKAKFSTQVGVGKYIVSDLTDVIFKVWDRTNGNELEKVGSNVVANSDFETALVHNGKPMQWDYAESYLHLLPPPDGIYVIEFVYKVIYSPLVNTIDVPVVPSPWHRGIVILASVIYYDDQGHDAVKATYNRVAYKDWLSDQPVEEYEQTEAIDSGIEIPTLGSSQDKRLDFDHSD